MAARHHERDGNYSEHRQPDRHHGDEAEGAAERLERAGLVDFGDQGPDLLTASHHGNRDPLDRRFRQAEQACDEGRFLDDGMALTDGLGDPGGFAFAQQRLVGNSVALRLAGDDSSVKVEVAVADHGGEGPVGCNRLSVGKLGRKMLRSCDGVVAENRPHEHPRGDENRQAERESDKKYEDRSSELGNGHGQPLSSRPESSSPVKNSLNRGRFAREILPGR